MTHLKYTMYKINQQLARKINIICPNGRVAYIWRNVSLDDALCLAEMLDTRNDKYVCFSDDAIYVVQYPRKLYQEIYQARKSQIISEYVSGVFEDDGEEFCNLLNNISNYDHDGNRRDKPLSYLTFGCDDE